MQHEIEFTAAQELAEHTILRIEEMANDGILICDLHNEIFNTDYYIVGYWAAEQFLVRCGGVFPCIALVKYYEINEFGAVHTDLSNSEHVCNMIAYIEGREVLNQSRSFLQYHDEELTPELAKQIIYELKCDYDLD